MKKYPAIFIHNPPPQKKNQPNKQTNKQTSKQASKQINKQTNPNKQTLSVMLLC